MEEEVKSAGPTVTDASFKAYRALDLFSFILCPPLLHWELGFNLFSNLLAIRETTVFLSKCPLYNDKFYIDVLLFRNNYRAP